VVLKPSYKADKPQIHIHYTENAGVQFMVLAGNTVCMLLQCLN